MTQGNPSLRILVADDDVETRHFLRELLTRLGHQAFCVATGRELADLAPQVQPDLLLVDVVMPDTDGIAAITEINRRMAVPAVLVSGHPAAGWLSRAPRGPPASPESTAGGPCPPCWCPATPATGGWPRWGPITSWPSCSSPSARPT